MGKIRFVDSHASPQMGASLPVAFRQIGVVRQVQVPGDDRLDDRIVIGDGALETTEFESRWHHAIRHVLQFETGMR